MYKLIAVDMDGTLLNDKSELTEKTIETVKKLIEKGGIFTISTGRPVQGLKTVIEKLGLKGPMITYNGAILAMAEDSRIIFHKKLEETDAKMILDMGLRLNTTIVVWSDNRLYVNVINDRVNDYKKLSGVEPIVIHNYDEIIKQGITKILWYDTVENVNKYLMKLKDYVNHTAKFCTSKPTFIEFFNSGVSKAEGIYKLSEMYNIKTDEIIAVGDGYNDLEMIEAAGLGVVMANAPDDLKELADYIAPSNEEDGVAEVIEQFML